MENNISVTQDRDKIAEQAEESFRAAITLATYEGRLVWTVFRSLLGANAFLITFSGAILKLYPSLVGLPIVLSIIGGLMCIAWFLISLRQFDYYKYWFAWARQLEESAFGSVSRMIRDGEKYAEGESVTCAGTTLRMGWGSRLFKVRWLLSTMIFTFLVIYIFLFVHAVRGY